MSKPVIKQNRKRRERLLVERLESRIALDGSAVSAAAALPWFDPGSLTYSFALDGTQLGNSQSNLHSVLNQVADSEQWQLAFDKAFSDWLTPLGAQIHKVVDTGAAFGSFGPTQGDRRFGDVRVGAVPLSNNILAEAIPHSMLVQGSWAGDILLNSNANWNSLDQVYSAVLHEFGHVLGLGHNTDPTSAMFVGGLHPGMAPSKSDIQLLKKTYAGVAIEHELEPYDPRPVSTGDLHESPQFTFDPKKAIPIQATLGSSVRYNSNGELTAVLPTALYKLLPLGEIDHAEYLNIVVLAKDINGLIPSLTIYDESGDKIKFQVTHNSAGTLSLQANDVEPNHTYYVAITGAFGPALNQIGRFEFLAEYGSEAIVNTKVGTFVLGGNKPIAEYSLILGTSRLVHWMINAKTISKLTQNVAVWGTLVDSQNHILSQVAIRPGDTRSAPLVLLPAGNYRILLQTGIQGSTLVPSVTTTLYVDEISVNIGAGIVDPLLEPMISCDTPGTNPTTCVGTTPIVINGPIFPDPITFPPIYPLFLPWLSQTWDYWPSFTPTSARVMQNASMPLDVTGDLSVSPLDVLAIINALNLAGNNSEPTSNSEIFVDTNGDGALSPLDALLVINYLNSKVLSKGEGKGISSLSWMFAHEMPDDDMSHRARPKMA